MATEWSVGDLVWAKMKSYPWWPAMIAPLQPSKKKPTGKKPTQFVMFFGSNDFAWISDDLIKPYEEHHKEHSSNNATTFKRAMAAIEKHIEENSGGKVSSPPKPQADVSQTNGVTPKKKKPKVLNKVQNKGTKNESKIIQNSISKPAVKRRLSDAGYSGSSSSKVPARDQYDELKHDLSTTYIQYPSSSDPDDSLSWLPETSRKTSARPPPPDLEEMERKLQSEEEKFFSSEKRGEPQLNYKPLDKKLGFIGLGIIGGGIAKNLVNSGHTVTVWNRTPENTKSFRGIDNVKVVDTPQDVAESSDIIFSCVSNPEAAKEVVFGNCGILKAMTHEKSYIEMTSIDPETSKNISFAIEEKNGRYLECPVIGCRETSLDGKLIILAAGNSKVFEEIKPCFHAIGRHAFYLGEIGNAAIMNILLSTLQGTAMACLAEGMSLAKKINLSRANFLELLGLVPYSSAFLNAKARAIVSENFYPSTPLEYLQKNLQLTLELADRSSHPLPTIAAANEVFKHAKHLGYAKHDVAAVYMARF